MTNTQKSRLFFTVSTPDIEKEIFQTREEAQEYAEQFVAYTIKVEEVKNYYQEENGEWNYEDYSDTFKSIITTDVKN